MCGWSATVAQYQFVKGGSSTQPTKALVSVVGCMLTETLKAMPAS